VNALRHAHTLLIPGGTLVDAHPVTEERVESTTAVIGTIAEPEWLGVDLPNSEDGLRQVVREGLFTLEAEFTYDVVEHFDETTDLLELKNDVLEGQQELIAAIQAASPPLRAHFSVVARRLRAVPGPSVVIGHSPES
jgi:hypothetical protein